MSIAARGIRVSAEFVRRQRGKLFCERFLFVECVRPDCLDFKGMVDWSG